MNVGFVVVLRRCFLIGALVAVIGQLYLMTREHPSREIMAIQLHSYLDGPESGTARRPMRDEVHKIAYAIAYVPDSSPFEEGINFDAAAVLAHSIYLHSIRNNASFYDYKLYALVSNNANDEVEAATKQLQTIGYEVLRKDNPVVLRNVQDKELYKRYQKRPLALDHFIKLYAYTLTNHPIVVLLSPDSFVTKPMDDLFDVMIYGDIRARRGVSREKYSTMSNASHWPKNVEAAFVRNWADNRPGRKPGYLDGFLAVKPNKVTFDHIVRTIQTTCT
jgi:hypothetical protein